MLQYSTLHVLHAYPAPASLLLALYVSFIFPNVFLSLSFPTTTFAFPPP